MFAVAKFYFKAFPDVPEDDLLFLLSESLPSLGFPGLRALCLVSWRRRRDEGPAGDLRLHHGSGRPATREHHRAGAAGHAARPGNQPERAQGNSETCVSHLSLCSSWAALQK